MTVEQFYAHFFSSVTALVQMAFKSHISNWTFIIIVIIFITIIIFVVIIIMTIINGQNIRSNQLEAMKATYSLTDEQKLFCCNEIFYFLPWKPCIVLQDLRSDMHFCYMLRYEIYRKVFALGCDPPFGRENFIILLYSPFRNPGWAPYSLRRWRWLWWQSTIQSYQSQFTLFSCYRSEEVRRIRFQIKHFHCSIKTKTNSTTTKRVFARGQTESG